MKNRDMTQGVIWKQMVLYAIPILLGNLLQQLYNAFDAIVVGNYVSNDALAAVGASGPLINVLIAFFMGLSMGSTVIISQSFGARDDRSLHAATHTAMTVSFVFGILLSVLGVILSPVLLRWISTPESVIVQATIYLRIFFAGMAALTVYNMGAAILRAVGDSRRPLYFLMLSTVINVVGNLIFVLVFDMGIAGVAWSTVIAEIISAIGVVIVLCREHGAHKLVLSKLRVHKEIMLQILKLGLPAAIQHGLISFSNVFVQSYINGLGSNVMSGYTVNSKIDAFIMLPGQTMAMTTTTFVGQNLGARKVKRAREGVKYGLAIALGTTVLVASIVMLFSHQVIRIFTPDATLYEYAYAFVRIMVPTYVIMVVSQVLPGALRGAGDVNFATVTGVVTFVGLRQVWLFLATKINYTITVVALGFPVSWLVSAVALIWYYRRSDWSRYEPVTPMPEVEAEVELPETIPIET